MSKWFEVEVRAQKVILVEMEADADEEDAAFYAMREVELDYPSIYEAVATEITGANIEVAKRHADDVHPL